MGQATVSDLRPSRPAPEFAPCSGSDRDVITPSQPSGAGATGMAPAPSSARLDRAFGDLVRCGADGVAYSFEQEPITNFRRPIEDVEADLDYEARRDMIAFESTSKRMTPVAVRPGAHVIEDIHYEPGDGPSWSMCSCGTFLEAKSPGGLAKRWRAHGGKGAA